LRGLLAYFLYGEADHYQLELTYSLLSAREHLRASDSGIRFLMISDERNRRPDLPAEALVASPEELRAWQLDGTYNHAAKHGALQAALRRYGVPTVLIDSDTMFRGHPEQLFQRIAPGRMIMHCDEGALADLEAELPAYRQLIAQTGGRVGGVPVSLATRMYNSGIIGLAPEDADLLDRSRALMRAILAEVDVFTTEQLALGMVANERMTLGTSEDVVTHYWGGPRAYYRYQIRRSLPGLAQGDRLTALPDRLQVLRDLPPTRRSVGLRARLLRALRKGDGIYAHAWSCAEHARRAMPDVELANVWAEMALSVLRYGLRERPPQFARDFAAFAPDRLAGLGWMQPKLRSAWAAYWAAPSGA